MTRAKIISLVREAKSYYELDFHSYGGPSDPQRLLCPVCKYHHVHHEDRAEIIEGNDSYDAAPKNVRGSVIATPMHCESGHRFIVCMGFHKGEIHVWAVKGQNIRAPKD